MVTRSSVFTQYNTGQYHGTKGLDINVLPAWMQGFTGTGTVVAVIDDGRHVEKSGGERKETERS